jgi:predicted alpha/beta superfamily hydrolase
VISRRRLLGTTALLTLFPQLLRAQEPDRIVDLGRMPSKYVAPTQVFVWLPPGYDADKNRYGVVYMHDGQNLFDPNRSNFNKVWAADKSALRLIAAGKTKPFIIVGIDQPGEDRGRQYFPRALEDFLAPAVQEKLKSRRNGKPVISDEYLRFIVDELKLEIDRLFLTRPSRKYTAIAGSSMGGLISLYAITKYPKVFGAAGAVSTHLPLGNPNWSNEERKAIFDAWRRYVREKLGKPMGRRIWFDHGTETLDAFYQPYQEVLDAALSENGWRKGLDFSSRVYPGTPHEENAWAARLDDVFGWMLKDW